MPLHLAVSLRNGQPEVSPRLNFSSNGMLGTTQPDSASRSRTHESLFNCLSQHHTYLHRHNARFMSNTDFALDAQ